MTGSYNPYGHRQGPPQQPESHVGRNLLIGAVAAIALYGYVNYDNGDTTAAAPGGQPTASARATAGDEIFVGGPDESATPTPHNEATQTVGPKVKKKKKPKTSEATQTIAPDTSKLIKAPKEVSQNYHKAILHKGDKNGATSRVIDHLSKSGCEGVDTGNAGFNRYNWRVIRTLQKNSIPKSEETKESYFGPETARVVKFAYINKDCGLNYTHPELMQSDEKFTPGDRVESHLEQSEESFVPDK